MLPDDVEEEVLIVTVNPQCPSHVVGLVLDAVVVLLVLWEVPQAIEELPPRSILLVAQLTSHLTPELCEGVIP